MANGTPSNTIPLGSDLLAAMGDIKGAASAMAGEAKKAKADAREATKELKAAEREAKKANDAIEKMRKKGGPVTQEQKLEAKRLDEIVKKKSDEAFARSQKSTEKQVALARAKSEMNLERNMLKNMNQYERRVNSKLLGVRDTMQNVAKNLQGTNIPALQYAGKQIGKGAGAISSKSVSGIAEVAGAALRVGGLATAGIAGGMAVAALAERHYNRNVETVRTQGRIDDTLTAALSAMAGQSVTGAQASMLPTGLRRQAAIASRQATRESITGRLIGDEGYLAEMIGTTLKSRQRQEELSKIFLDDQLIAERYGQEVANNLDLEKLARSKGIGDKVQRSIDVNYTRAIAESLTGRIGGSIGVSAVSEYYRSQDEAKRNELARQERESIISNIQAKIAQDQKEMREDVMGASRRKINAVRDQSLEAERLRRSMQTARF